jgi:S-adenosylmethionine:tRNA ribosyltransferase-isomerase
MSFFFDYNLPDHLIAQQPAARRDESRLLVLRRTTGELAHHIFRDLPDLLAPNDLLVLNDTKVLPARIIGRREQTGGKWEGLFLRQTADGLWELLAQSRGYPAVGEGFAMTPDENSTSVVPGSETFRLLLRGRTPERHWLMEPDPPGSPPELLARFGRIPLPPYIRKGRAGADDSDRYQTVFAAHAGSVAAPTAGLHFTPDLLNRLAAKGIGTARVTLHVGLGTFAPVKVDNPAEHMIHREWCEVTPQAVDAIQAARTRGGRVVAVGTTATRTLETAATPIGLEPFRGDTGLYIYPPYEFRAVGGLVTNFHLPKTTLLLLVGAFAGSDLLQRAYAEAIRCEYRFFSYGDAMLVL